MSVLLLALVAPQLRGVRGLRGGGHLARALSHYPYLAIAVLVVIVALVIWSNKTGR